MPSLDGFSEAQFRELSSDAAFQVGAHGVAVEGRRLVGRVFPHGGALHEQALDGIERRQLEVTAALRVDLGADVEQFRQEVLQRRGRGDHQFGFRLAGQFGRVRPRGDKPLRKRRIAALEVSDERVVYSREALAVVQ